MKALHIRVYTGDIRPYLRPDRLKVTAQGRVWRGWVAWESFPGDANSEPLKLAARTTLAGEQEHTEWAAGYPTGVLQQALQGLIGRIKKIGAGWALRG